MRVYDSTYPEEVAGFVFVDASHPERQQRAPAGAPSGLGPPAPIARILSRSGVLRLVTYLSARGRVLPHEEALVALLPGSMLANLAEIAALDSTAAQGARTGDLGDRPVVVLTSGSPTPEVPPGPRSELYRRFEEVRLQLQREVAGLSTNSDHRFVEDAGHAIQAEAPGAVGQAIQDVVDAVRSGQRVVRR